MERKDCGTCKFRKSDALGTGRGIIINQPKDCIAFSHYEPQEPSPKSEVDNHECSNCGYFNSENCGECYTGNPINWIPKHSVDKQEPKVAKPESVRDILANFFDGLYDAKRTLRKTLKDYDDLYEQAESRIRAIIEKENKAKEVK